jgi:hypothetical protein
MDRIKSTPASATQGLGSITISVRTAGSLFVGPARQDRYASAFLWVHLTIPHFPRRPYRSGRSGVTHGRLKSAMSSIGTPNRHQLDTSPPRTYCYRGAQSYSHGCRWHILPVPACLLRRQISGVIRTRYAPFEQSRLGLLVRAAELSKKRCLAAAAR